jgi:hypothetical protein
VFAATSLLSLEEMSAAGLFLLELGSGLVFKRLVAFHEVEADAVETMGGVEGGFDLAQVVVKGVEEGRGEGGIVLGDAEGHLVKRIAENGVAMLGEVAGAVGERVETDKGPDLRSAQEAMDGAETGAVGGPRSIVRHHPCRGAPEIGHSVCEPAIGRRWGGEMSGEGYRPGTKVETSQREGESK